jgi:hypothetical protein
LKGACIDTSRLEGTGRKIVDALEAPQRREMA